MHLIVFVSEQQHFCVPSAQTLEVTRMVEVTPMPSDSGKVNGLLNYRGSLLPVIDIRRYFGLEITAYDLNHVLVIIEYAGQKAALICDQVLNIFEVPDQEVVEYTGLAAEYCHAAVRFEDGVLPILNLARVMQDIQVEMRK